MEKLLKNPALLQKQGFINGQFVDSSSKAVFAVTDPSSGNVVAEVADMTVEDTYKAIADAQIAFESWKTTTAKSRAQILRKWFELINENIDDLATILSVEQGKGHAEAKGEIAYGNSFIEWFAEEGKRINGITMQSPLSTTRMSSIKQPIGVVAAITPWNFPNAMITRKVAPALAAGCTIVLKPADETPLSALALAYLGKQAGIPDGVFSVIPSKDAVGTGKAMCESPIVKKLTFTGSTRVGKILMQQCADTVKKLSLELGGNAPFIVFDDADLDDAIDGLMIAKYRNAGQTCVCANRIFVQEGVYDTFAKKLSERVATLKIGAWNEPGVQIGPLINANALSKVEDHVSNAKDNGGCVLTGGKGHEKGALFYEPTVITGVTKDMKVFSEETFGPLAPLFKFKDEKEAIALANDTEFGLAAYFYSRDIGRIVRVSEALESGMVGVNTGLISNEVAPFGGIKQSGLGREGSAYGIEEYLEIKYICLGAIDK